MMAMYAAETQARDYGQDVPQPEDPLEELKARHKALGQEHAAMRNELLDALRKDCERLERDCKGMADLMAFIRRMGPEYR